MEGSFYNFSLLGDYYYNLPKILKMMFKSSNVYGLKK